MFRRLHHVPILHASLSLAALQYECASADLAIEPCCFDLISSTCSKKNIPAVQNAHIPEHYVYAPILTCAHDGFAHGDLWMPSIVGMKLTVPAGNSHIKSACNMKLQRGSSIGDAWNSNACSQFIHGQEARFCHARSSSRWALVNTCSVLAPT